MSENKKDFIEILLEEKEKKLEKLSKEEKEELKEYKELTSDDIKKIREKWAV